MTAASDDRTAAEGRRPVGRDRLAALAAAVGPLAVTAALVPFRRNVANTDAALILVLVIVAVAGNGHRTAGLLAAASAAVCFDFFLTQPYGQLAITSGQDVETMILLLLVGAGVTELAVWGRRQHAAVQRQTGYEAGIREAARSMADTGSPSVTIDRVTDQLTTLLGLTTCSYDYGAGVLGGRLARLRSDGQVEVAGQTLDIDRDGLPTDRAIELLVRSGFTYRGRFLMYAAPGGRPSLGSRLIAAAMAERVGAALTRSS